MKNTPSYLFLSQNEWNEKIDKAFSLASPCILCPRKCMAKRLEGQIGFCRAKDNLVISSIFPHHGEEPPISGTNGSGTIFFTYCSLKCCFCQNYQISHQEEGQAYSVEQLAEKMLWLQNLGVHNINLVTPTHFLPWIIKSIKTASEHGLNIPIVWNSSGYELTQPLQLLKGIIDIYLPDMKYGDNKSSFRYCKAKDYVEINKLAIKEMFKQVGPLKFDKNGIAKRGLCIRHLVLPEGKSFSEKILLFLKENFDPSDIWISLMAQYRPMYKAFEFPELSRQITQQEYEPLKNLCEEYGFNGFFQEISDLDDKFCIDFKKRKHEPLTGK
jgi:putative pyruvate formate lyase activating enzyme